MKKLILAVAVSLLLGGVIISDSLPQSARAFQFPRPGQLRARRRMVWEPSVKIDGRMLVRGFWRPTERRGYRWRETHQDEIGRWFPGYWEPLVELKHPDGKLAWVPGRRGREGWIPGYWRPFTLPGMIWHDGYFDLQGRWHSSYWEKRRLGVQYN